MSKPAIILFIVLFVISTPKVLCQLNNETIDIGIGFGGTYSFLGTNLNIYPNDYIVLFYSIGLRPASLPDNLSTQYDEDGYQWNWGAGIRLQGPQSGLLKVRLTLYYGLNTWTEHYINADDIKNSKTFMTWGKGFSVGFGLSGKFKNCKNLGIDFDMFYTIQSESYLPKAMDIYGKEKYPLKTMAEGFASIGLRYYFDINFLTKKEKPLGADEPL